MSTAPLVSDLQEALQREGPDSLDPYGPGPFLLEIPIQPPRGADDPADGSSVSETSSWDREILLGLKRVRGSDNARVFAISHDAVVGRAPGCAVCLPEDDAVSKEHVRFQKLGSSWHLEDLGSENGTYVCRKKVRKDPVFLKSLDLIQIGGHRFAFATAADLRSLLVRNTSTEAIPIGRVLAELEALGSKRFMLRYDTPCLLLAYRRKGEAGGEFLPSVMFPLAGPGPLTVGRTRHTNIQLEDKRVSKQHARISHLPGERCEVEDLGAANPTLVGGQKLSKGQKASIGPWETISFGPGVWGLYHSPRTLLENLTELRRTI